MPQNTMSRPTYEIRKDFSNIPDSLCVALVAWLKLLQSVALNWSFDPVPSGRSGAS
jgi:hypothetical protein